jgi:hypothetical protein
MSWYLLLGQAVPSLLAQAAESEETSWILRKLVEPTSIPVLAIILGCGIGAIAVIGHYVTDAYKARSLNQLKRHMLEQGMSPEDIERVIRAGAAKEPEEGS